MSERRTDKAQYELIATQLAQAYADRDDRSFAEAVNQLREVADKLSEKQWAHLSTRIRSALEGVREDPSLARLVGQDVRDARLRLDHVIQLTADAAHRTLALIESSVPLLERTESGAQALLKERLQRASLSDRKEPGESLDIEVEPFLRAVCADLRDVRRNLGEVLMAQSYQDLSGQLIRRVIEVVVDIETELGQLERGARSSAWDSKQSVRAQDTARGCGPAVPGIEDAVNAQLDVDQLLSMSRHGD